MTKAALFDQYITKLTRKELHGWYPGKRECTGERLLINPYNGCSVGCFFCYARALPGDFSRFHREGIITVAEDFHKSVARQLDSINVASCGYLSPVTDPFQPVNSVYRLSEKIISEFVKRNIPVEFITKCRVPDEAVELISGHPHCFAQASVLTTDESLRKILAPGGARTGDLFSDLKKMSKKGIYTVCRIDPVLPYITDSGANLGGLVRRAADAGVKHVVASVMDIPVRTYGWVLGAIGRHFGAAIAEKYRRLYTERIGYVNARIDYRKRIFTSLAELCKMSGLTFALCMEYEKQESPEGAVVRGLNRNFMTSRNCEGIDVPVYVRRSVRFEPAADCSGACLNCSEPACGITELAMARKPSTAGAPAAKTAFKLSDYRRWSSDKFDCPKLKDV